MMQPITIPGSSVIRGCLVHPERLPCYAAGKRAWHATGKTVVWSPCGSARTVAEHGDVLGAIRRMIAVSEPLTFQQAYERGAVFAP